MLSLFEPIDADDHTNTAFQPMIKLKRFCILENTPFLVLPRELRLPPVC